MLGYPDLPVNTFLCSEEIIETCSHHFENGINHGLLHQKQPAFNLIPSFNRLAHLYFFTFLRIHMSNVLTIFNVQAKYIIKASS